LGAFQTSDEIEEIECMEGEVGEPASVKIHFAYLTYFILDINKI